MIEDLSPLIFYGVVLAGIVLYARRAETQPEPHRRRVPTPVLLVGPLLAVMVVAVYVGFGKSLGEAIILAAPALITGGIALVWAVLRRGA